jgi:hypothetical protein
MAKLIDSAITSLDGYVADENGTTALAIDPGSLFNQDLEFRTAAATLGRELSLLTEPDSVSAEPDSRISAAQRKLSNLVRPARDRPLDAPGTAESGSACA